MLLLILGSVLTLLFVVLTVAGGSDAYLLDSLTGDAFPLKSVYTAGFPLLRLFKPKGKFARSVRESCSLYYGKQYADYYTHITWAQTLSMGLLLLTLTLLLASLLRDLSGFILLVGLVFTGYTCWYFLTYAKEKVATRETQCSAELPNAISKMALLVNSGVILHEAWQLVAFGKEGVFYDLMRDACEQMDNGVSDSIAIYEFGVRSNAPEIKKFASALIQSVERGGGELSRFLTNQSSELWNHRRQAALQNGEKAASALLAPIALMFIGVILIIVAAALQSFSL